MSLHSWIRLMEGARSSSRPCLHIIFWGTPGTWQTLAYSMSVTNWEHITVALPKKTTSFLSKNLNLPAQLVSDFRPQFSDELLWFGPFVVWSQVSPRVTQTRNQQILSCAKRLLSSLNLTVWHSCNPWKAEESTGVSQVKRRYIIVQTSLEYYVWNRWLSCLVT